MLSRHFQEDCTPVLPPLTLAPPGNSVLRCIALGPQLDFSLIDIFFILRAIVLPVVINFGSLSSILVFHYYAFSATRLIAYAFIVPAEPLFSPCRMFYLLQFSAPWFCLAALAANAAAFGRSLRWVFQGFPISDTKGAKEFKSCRI